MRYEINDFFYNDEKGIVEKNEKIIQLTKTQKALLNYFISHPNKTLSKQVLMEDVWQRIVNDNSVNKSISKLRAILEKDPVNPEIIVTVFGHGFSFEGVVTEVDSLTHPKIHQGTTNRIYLIPTIILGFIAVIVLGDYFYKKSKPSVQTASANYVVNSLAEDQNLLIFPTVYLDLKNKSLANGSNEMIQSTLKNLNVKGEILFDVSDLPNEEVMEKYWKIQNDLVILHTKVVKKVKFMMQSCNLPGDMMTSKLLSFPPIISEI